MNGAAKGEAAKKRKNAMASVFEQKKRAVALVGTSQVPVYVPFKPREEP